MAYERRMLARRKIAYNNDSAYNKLTFQFVLDDEKVTPTSATIAIYKPGSTTAVLSATAMTLTGSLLTYSVDTTTVADFPVDTGYRADIAVTYSTVVYDRHFVFDVVKYPYVPAVAHDQLVALDDAVNSMLHAGDDDFSELIGACWDIVSTKIETHFTEGEKFNTAYLIDNSQMDTAFRFYVLHRVWLNAGNMERSESYKEDFSALFQSVMNTAKIDDDQDGQENDDPAGVQPIRLRW